MSIKPKKLILLLLGLLAYLPYPVLGAVLTEDTTWEGAVVLDDDLLVPAGITLTIRAGTVIAVNAAESTKTDPEFLSPLTELAVRGTLIVEGDPASPVLFRLAKGEEGAWAGVLIAGGTARLRSCTIQGAETGIQLLAGTLELEQVRLTGNRYGLVVQDKEAEVAISESTISENDYGLLIPAGVELARQETTIDRNAQRNVLVRAVPNRSPSLPEYRAEPPGPVRVLEDEVLLGEVVWQGRLEINGQIRQPPGSRLIILPGTVIEFRKKDTDRDGIGENGLLLQGVLIAKGTAVAPILFRSAEQEPRPGDWDAINIINSDGALNLIEYCQIENGYRGLHFHFANVAIQDSIFRRNYRGVQFQESAVALRRNTFYANTSAIQARDSEIQFLANLVTENFFGANFFRSQLTLAENSFTANRDFGLKIREGFPSISRNVFSDNRYGLMVNDARFGRVAENLILGNGEAGLALKAAANLEISHNFIQANGLSGINLRDVNGLIRENQISENGERGIGAVSFYGVITRNNFIGNGQYAIGVDDAAEVVAPANWFGGIDPQQAVYDQRDEPGLGLVRHQPAADRPSPYLWPLATIPVDLGWQGSIAIPGTVTVPAGISLQVAPGTRLAFADQAGLLVRGRLAALGRPEARITFTSLEKQTPGAWSEIRLEHAAGSEFANCDFEYATWGLHSHFTGLPVSGCTFTENIGGIRFRSGPLSIKNSSFRRNEIGIRAFRGQAEITGNLITENRKGIFVREQGGGLSIHHNNIVDNHDYSIWIGDFNQEDVQAPQNWWGNTAPARTIFDANREPGIGFVRYEPVLEKAVEVER